ncbi:DUF2950 family protein [Dokdonella sp.]|uniref:DUF2950 family protein n=1 Tax=Dokdonella sp. TaxID=2291710 RepID=UPI003C5E43E5
MKKQEFSIRSVRLAILLALIVPAVTAFAADGKKDFNSPDEAANALIEAARSNDDAVLSSLFGKDSARIVQDGKDPGVAAARERFVAAADEVLLIQENTADNVTLLVGADAFTYPVPLIRKGQRWEFDGAAGANELANRRVGLNELMTMTVLEELPLVQEEFESVARDGSNVRTYAQKFLSDPGKHNGLYWEAAENEAQSPLGPMLKDIDTRIATSYYGYNYRMLTRQGAAAPGGAYDYMVNGNMIGGFAAIAVPTRYGETGVMTFIVNRYGMVYQKDLGEQSAEIAKALTSYDPDSSWSLARDEAAESTASE